MNIITCNITSAPYTYPPPTPKPPVPQIVGLNSISIGGQEELEYGGEVISVLPLLEDASAVLPHDRRGLLTRQRLSRGPEFGVTLGPVADLDGRYQVFGRLLQVSCCVIFLFLMFISLFGLYTAIADAHPVRGWTARQTPGRKKKKFQYCSIFLLYQKTTKPRES